MLIVSSPILSYIPWGIVIVAVLSKCVEAYIRNRRMVKRPQLATHSIYQKETPISGIRYVRKV